MAALKPIIGTSYKIFIVGPEIDQVLITTADSTAWAITDDAGVTLSSGTLTYIATLPVDGWDTYGGWYANITFPTTPQRVHAHMTITKSSAVQRWHAVYDVVDFS